MTRSGNGKHVSIQLVNEGGQLHSVSALPLPDKAARLAPTDTDACDTGGVTLSNLPRRLPNAGKKIDASAAQNVPSSPPPRKGPAQLGRDLRPTWGRFAVRKHLTEALRTHQKTSSLTPRQRIRKILNRLLKNVGRQPSAQYR